EVATGQPYVLQDSSLDGLALGLLEAERQRIEKLMSADVQTQRQYAAVTSKISAECAVLQTSTAKLTDAQGARGRAVELTRSREQAYQRAFDAILAEQAVLEDLYAPLKARLAASSGTLRKLSFIVRRTADVQKWAQEGEELFLDRRKQGPFRGKGRLVEYAEETLGPAWERGTAEEVAAAMNGFREKHQADLLKEAPVPRTEQADYRAWSKKFAQWLFGTQHIRIEYQIEYDGVDIRKLSPGTRGIVLLLLYLALDDADDRPLIIDQPEENLDPKSVYDELVPLFVEAKNRRQVIIVTHNANLVVNTDADQIIVAKVGDHVPGALPPIEYRSGGLDDEKMRQTVCEILEGGERAFRERARRLRVAW
ncbi:MAG: ATP-binding protein, partial [Proteobacteria bacterium]|nr:ATP-binding protein [Pseudomonadota bacterium]